MLFHRLREPCEWDSLSQALTLNKIKMVHQTRFYSVNFKYNKTKILRTKTYIDLVRYSLTLLARTTTMTSYYLTHWQKWSKISWILKLCELRRRHCRGLTHRYQWLSDLYDVGFFGKIRLLCCINLSPLIPSSTLENQSCSFVGCKTASLAVILRRKKVGKSVITAGSLFRKNRAPQSPWLLAITYLRKTAQRSKTIS